MSEGPDSGDSIPPWASIEYYLANSLSAIYPVSDTDHLALHYEVHGPSKSVMLLVELPRSEKCPSSPSPRIEVTEVRYRGMRSAQVRTNSVDLLRDFHDLTIAVVDRILREGFSLQDALSATIDSWHRLIDTRSSLQAIRTGLHGELAILDSVAVQQGWRRAMQSWVGPEGAVHDFSLAGFDLEVKTTTSESRIHSIHGLEQLTPKPGRELWCASIQLAPGGAAGRTLTETVEATLAAAYSTSREVGAKLLDLIQSAGYSKHDPQALDERWSIRSEPLMLSAIHVPRIAPELLGQVAQDRISNVTYSVNLSGLPPDVDPPLDLTSFRLP